MKNFVLYITQKCNLNCSYCFVKQKNQHIPIKEYIDYMKKETQKKEQIWVHFFGGEPLLNFEGIQEVVNSMKNYNVRYKITTNGTLLNQENVQFFKEHNFEVKISIDGTKESHNRTRKFKNHKGSWDAVVEGIHLIKKSNITFDLHMTYHPKYSELFEGLKSMMEFKPRFVIFYPLYEQIEKKEEENIKKEFKKLGKWYINKIKTQVDFPFIVPFESFLKKLRLKDTSFRLCGAWEINRCLSQNQQVYACPRMINYERYKVGNFHKMERKKEQLNLLSLMSYQFINPECNTCEAKDVCDLTFCSSSNYMANGNDFIKPSPGYCSFVRIMRQAAVDVVDKLKSSSYFEHRIKEYATKEVLAKYKKYVL